MSKWIKWLFFSVLFIVLLAAGSAFFLLNQSLPQLEGTVQSPTLSATVKLQRDTLGQAVIHASTRPDAAFALGYAHAQDRFFQMDLQRKVAAGELSGWLGSKALDADRKARFHQFRARARNLLTRLPSAQRTLLARYSKGVNTALSDAKVRTFEYWLTRYEPAPWTPEDSLLVIFSMYIDLQLGQVELDLARTGVQRYFGEDMLRFLQQSSEYQAALQGSTLPPYTGDIPALDAQTTARWQGLPPPDIGSNNWAVSGQLTTSGQGMLANDMHLGLRVPIIWYRAQLNYTRNNQQVQVTGVSLPGLPGIVVGTNGAVAWGFTNANLDNVDWVALPEDARTWQVNETLATTGEPVQFPITMSDYGPVRELDGRQYALKWVAHQPYAVTLDIMNLDVVQSTDEALSVAHNIRMPVQNMLVVDTTGAIAWTPAGAVTGRPAPTATAIPAAEFSAQWQNNTPAADLPLVKNPASQRLWTANARVISTDQLQRFGDGGYALGARALQIKQRLMAKDTFSEEDFYQIQLDNEALFLKPWHQLLTQTLQQQSQQYLAELEALANWQQCACPDSVGYTLVQRYRRHVVNALLSPVMTRLAKEDYRPNGLLRQTETAVWQLLNEQPDSWLPAGYKTWSEFLLSAWQETRSNLNTQMQTQSLAELNWGAVNALTVKHPFAANVPLVGDYLNRPAIAGYGDSYMPAVQQPEFGASQRLFVQPGRLAEAVLTLPGAQSGHPLSQFYRVGFNDYAEHKSTPLLPGPVRYTLMLEPAQ